MKKILIMYATYGTGHKKIAEYIENFFNENGDYEIKSIDILKYSTPILGNLSQKTFEKINFSIPFLWDKLYNTFNNKMTFLSADKLLLELFKNKKIRKEIELFNPDLVISTHFFCSSLIAYYKKRNIINSNLITVITDYEAHEYWLKNEKYEDALIIGNSLEKKNLVKKGIQKNKIKDIGIPLSNLFDPALYDSDKTIKKYKLDKNKKTVLFFCSRGKITSEYTKILVKENLHYNIIIVTGNNTKEKEHINNYRKQFLNKNVKVLGFINNVPELINIADLVITKPGGATVTECLHFNKPMLFVGEHSGQEKANASFLSSSGCSVIVKNANNMIFQINRILQNREILLNMKQSTRKIKKNNSMKKLFVLSNKIMNER